MKKFLFVLLSLLLLLSLSSCKEDVVEAANVVEETNTIEEVVVEEEVVEEIVEETIFENLYPDFIIDETEDTITYIDKFGTETKVSKSPEKVVIVYNSILGLWYFNGGEAITKAKGSTNVPEEAMELLDLGSAYSASLEAIVATEPTLVILAANVEPQVAMAPMLNEMGIETMIVDTSVNSYERFKENSYLFAKINRAEDVYDTEIKKIVESIDETIAKALTSEEKPKVAAILATSKNLSIDSNIALTGEVISLLGGENILKEEDVLAEGETRVTFSIEAIISQNPDIIMFSTMGSIDKTKENIQKMIDENPVWQEIEAVKNDRVYYLPKEYSIYKPNEKYDEAFMYIAEVMYPQLFEME